MADRQIGDFIKELKKSFEDSEMNQMQMVETLQGVGASVSKQTELFSVFAKSSEDSLLFQKEQMRDAKRNERLSKETDKGDDQTLSALAMLSADMKEFNESISKLKEKAGETFDFGVMVSPMLIALGSWLTDLDGYLRALRPDFILKPITTFVDLVTDVGKSMSTFAKSLTNIKLPGITVDWNTPLVQFVNKAGKQITDLVDVKFITPTINFVDNFGNIIKDVFDYKIHYPTLLFKDAAGKVIDQALDIKLPEVLTKSIDAVKSFFTATGSFFGKIAGLALPKVTFSIPSFDEFLDPIKKFIGTAEEGAESTGLMKMFGGLKKFIGPILKPLAAVTRIVSGPWVQGFLSLLDFVKGFADGFGTKEVVDEFGNVEQLSFGQRILNGLEGGVLGVVKGITDAFEALFFGIPGWIAEKLGFEKTAEYLKSLEITKFVDPIWNWAKDAVGWIIDLLPSWEDIKGYLRALVPDSLEKFIFEDAAAEAAATGPTQDPAETYDYSNYMRDQQGKSQPYGLASNEEQMKMLVANSGSAQQDTAAAMKDIAAYLAAAGGGGASNSVNNNQTYNEQKITMMMTDPERALRSFPGGF